MKKEELEKARNRLKLPPKVNALASASALETNPYRARAMDNTKPETKGSPPPEELKVVPNQKLEVLEALLSVGALHAGFSILAKFPWMGQAFPAIADLVLNIMRISFRPVLDRTRVSSPWVKYSNSNGARKSRFPTKSPASTVKHSTLTLRSPVPLASIDRQHTYFYADSDAWIPRCSSFIDLLAVGSPLMEICGTQLSRDAELVARLCVFGRRCISQVRGTITLIYIYC